MTLKELYNLKLSEYKMTGLKERPWKLLAMLLLSEMDKYDALKGSQGEFYQKYQKDIDKNIDKIENDFEFTKEDIIKYIEETGICDDYEWQRIWFVYAEGFGALNWGLLQQTIISPEEIYSYYFENDELKKQYDIEQMSLANNISITKLDVLLDRILECPSEFYKKICEALTTEERSFILKHLKNKKCSSCLNQKCHVVNRNNTDKSCESWYNDELIGKSKVLKIDDIHKLN